MMKLCLNIILIFSQNDFSNVYGENNEQIVEDENEIIHMVEDDIKSYYLNLPTNVTKTTNLIDPIFGSNSYNAIKNVFEPHLETQNSGINQPKDTNFVTTVHDNTLDDNEGTVTPDDDASHSKTVKDSTGPDNPDYNLGTGHENDNVNVITPDDDKGVSTHEYNAGTTTPDDDASHSITVKDSAGPDNPDYNLGTGHENDNVNVNTPDDDKGASTHEYNAGTTTPDDGNTSHSFTGGDTTGVDNPNDSVGTGLTNNNAGVSISDNNAGDNTNNDNTGSETPADDGISHGVTGSNDPDVANHKEGASTPVNHSDISDSNIALSTTTKETRTTTTTTPTPIKLSEEDDWWSKNESKNNSFLREGRKNITFVPNNVRKILNSDENIDKLFFTRKKNYKTRRKTRISYNKVINHVPFSDWWSRRQGSKTNEFLKELL